LWGAHYPRPPSPGRTSRARPRERDRERASSLATRDPEWPQLPSSLREIDGGFVLLDTVTTPELEAEGLARDMIRAVQETRKAAGFEVSDRIRLELLFADAGDLAKVESAFEIADVAGETLAREHVLGDTATGSSTCSASCATTRPAVSPR